MADPPSNYNNASIQVDPNHLYHVAKDIIPILLEGINENLNQISHTWEDLKLGWTGKTAEEAKRFSDRWDLVMRQLFDPPGDQKPGPGEGVMSKIANAVGQVAVNFGNAEHAVVEMFQKLTGGGGDSGPPSSSRDTNLGAIREDNTAKSPGH